MQKGTRRKSWHTAKIVDSDDDSVPLEFSPPSRSRPPDMSVPPPDMSVPPLAQPGDPGNLAPHINGSTKEGKSLGLAGEKGRVGDREVESGRGHAKGRRGSRRKKKREKREGKL